eukprot:TRINITY_DN6064_c0_g1_i3.p1 TRINITY_DN6064_c0_g1~~TRINITY_DN6064_c0_g1_i3.p1  ORF type:complete len:520 (+),score=131.43 TRINITY_DN6064_c0_g1_i3:40-1599(+)
MALAALCVGLCASTLAGVGDDAAPCPTAAAAGTRVRDECFNSTQGLRSCLTAAESDKKACKEAYAECTQGVVQGCFNEDWRQGNATYPAHTVKVRQTAAAFDGDLFEAAVAALLVLPPQYVVVTRADAVVSDRRAAAALGMGGEATLATFEVNKEGDVEGDVAALFEGDAFGGSAADAVFPLLGEGWGDVELVSGPGNATGTGTPAPAPLVAGGGEKVNVVVVVVGVMLLVFVGPGMAILCWSLWKRRARKELEPPAEAKEGDDQGDDQGDERHLRRSSCSISTAAASECEISLRVAPLVVPPAAPVAAPTPKSEPSTLPPDSAAPAEPTPAGKPPLGRTPLAPRDPNVAVSLGEVERRKGESGRDRDSDVHKEVWSMTPSTAANTASTPVCRGPSPRQQSDAGSLARPPARLQYDTPASTHPLQRPHPTPDPHPAPKSAARRAVPPWVTTPPPPTAAAAASPSPSPQIATVQRPRDWMVSAAETRHTAPTPSFCHKCGEEWQGGRFCGFCGVLALGAA